MKHPIFNCTILGQTTSKSNRSRIFLNRRTGKPFIFKSKEAKEYIEQFKNEIIRLGVKPTSPIEENVVLECTIYYASNRPDLDESQIMDCLQMEGIIKNDRQIKEKHIYHAIDKDMPRSDIKLYLLD